MTSATPRSTNTTWSSRMIDQIVEACNQLGVPMAAESALEHRELHPFVRDLEEVISMTRLEYTGRF